MNQQLQKTPASWPLIILFFIITLSVGVVGIMYYKYQKDNLLTEKLQELSSISDLKIRQITQWRFERMSDGRFLGDNLTFLEKISDFLGDPVRIRSRNMVLQNLQSLTENFDYKSAMLADRSGSVRLAFPARDTIIGENIRHLFKTVAIDRKILMTDLQINQSVNYAHIDLIVPLIDRNINDSLLQGFLILRIDPGKVLYPLIQSWPTASRSAETLIVRKESDEIVYLNELRHLKKTELILRKPLSQEKLPAALAFRGIKRDY